VGEWAGGTPKTVSGLRAPHQGLGSPPSPTAAGTHGCQRAQSQPSSRLWRWENWGTPPPRPFWGAPPANGTSLGTGMGIKKISVYFITKIYTPRTLRPPQASQWGGTVPGEPPDPKVGSPGFGGGRVGRVPVLGRLAWVKPASACPPPRRDPPQSRGGGRAGFGGVQARSSRRRPLPQRRSAASPAGLEPKRRDDRFK